MGGPYRGGWYGGCHRGGGGGGAGYLSAEVQEAYLEDFAAVGGVRVEGGEVCGFCDYFYGHKLWRVFLSMVQMR